MVRERGSIVGAATRGRRHAPEGGEIVDGGMGVGEGGVEGPVVVAEAVEHEDAVLSRGRRAGQLVVGGAEEDAVEGKPAAGHEGVETEVPAAV